VGVFLGLDATQQPDDICGTPEAVAIEPLDREPSTKDIFDRDRASHAKTLSTPGDTFESIGH
jgi:hypothetical protein